MFVVAFLKFLLRHYYFLAFHIVFNFLFAVWIYRKLRPYYKSILINEKYPEFRRYDQLSFLRIYIGLLVLVWPRFFGFIFFNAIMAYGLRIGKRETCHELKEKVLKFCSFMVLISLGAVIPKEIKKNEECEKIYKKYLGNDYNINKKRNFATVISNHVSFIDSYYFSYKYGASFVAKKSAASFPLIGTIGLYNQTIFLDRSSEKERKEAAKLIEERQKKIMNGTFDRQLVVFPEGTISIGRFLLKFKRGAFMSRLPLKPYIELINKNETIETSEGILPMPLHIILVCCYLYHFVTFIDMPVIEPTDYMYQNNLELGTENWMIYMEVTRRIMSEVGNLDLSESSFQEKLDYISAIKGHKVKNT